MGKNVHAHALNVYALNVGAINLLACYGGRRYRDAMETKDPLIESWRELLSQYSRVAHELDRALQARHGLTMSEYEVLDRLVDAEGCKSRTHDLVVDLHLSQSASSRAVARL